MTTPSLPAPVRLSTLPDGARFAPSPRHLALGVYFTKLSADAVRMTDGTEAPPYGDPAVWPAPAEPASP